MILCKKSTGDWCRCVDVRLYCVYSDIFFFFKQKTAYEMRISDWSSDVCSSDLIIGIAIGRYRTMRAPGLNADRPRERVLLAGERRSDRLRVNRRDVIGFGERVGDYLPVGVKVRDVKDRFVGINIGYSAIARSEEHTSELQSLMRISYAVFCLKKKKKQNTNVK